MVKNSNVTFQGKNYPVKEIEVGNYGIHRISTISLEDKLLKADGNYVSDEARIVDNDIFYYMNDDRFDDISDEAIEAWLAKELAE